MTHPKRQSKLVTHTLLHLTKECPSHRQAKRPPPSGFVQTPFHSSILPRAGRRVPIRPAGFRPPSRKKHLKVMLEEEGAVKNGWPYGNIFLPIVDLLRQGITPEKIALSIARVQSLECFLY